MLIDIYLSIYLSILDVAHAVLSPRYAQKDCTFSSTS
jgi:hypothetical protein